MKNHSVIRSVMSRSLQPHGLFCSWNSPGQNTGVRIAVPFSRGSSQSRGWTQVSLSAGRFCTSWATREAQEYWSRYPIPSPAYLPDPGIEPGSPAVQVDSLPTELSRKISSKELACQCRRKTGLGFDLWVGKIPWRRAQQPTPVFLPGESFGQRSLLGYSP